MSISTYSELQTAVKNWMGRDDVSTTMVKQFITAAEIRICDDVKVKAMETTASGVIAEGDDDITYPTTAHGIKGDFFYYAPSENNLSYESEFGSWTATNGVVTSNVGSITDPDEGTDADLFTRSSTAAAHLSQSYTRSDTGKKRFTFSVYAKAKTGNYCSLRMAGTGSAKVDAIFNLSTGALDTLSQTTFTSTATTITDKLMDGWYRISVTGISDAFTTVTCYVSFNSNGVVVDGTDSAANSAGYLFDAELVDYDFRSTLEQREQSECYVREDDETLTGEPEWFSLDGSNLTVYPIPDDFYPYTYVYYNRLVLSDSATTNWLLTNYPMILLYASLLEAAIQLEDGMLTIYAGKYVEELKRLKRHENFTIAGSRSRKFKQVAL